MPMPPPPSPGRAPGRHTANTRPGQAVQGGRVGGGTRRRGQCVLGDRRAARRPRRRAPADAGWTLSGACRGAKGGRAGRQRHPGRWATTRRAVRSSPRPLFATCRRPAPLPPPPQSFVLHLGGALTLPSASPEREAAKEEATAAAAPRSYFDGVPLAAWAERIGARVMPAYEAIKEEEARLKKERASGVGRTARAPARLPVPSFLPFSAWAAASPALQATLIADDPATRRKARLSWYHPDDGMVPRDWLAGGLLADLAYYRPFRAPLAAEAAA